jgi:hypothetical protein
MELFYPKNMYSKTTTLFKHNYEATAHIVVNQGGTSSGKTYAIEQVLFCLAAESENQVITVVGQDIPNLKSGALRDAQAIYNALLTLIIPTGSLNSITAALSSLKATEMPRMPRAVSAISFL